MYRYILRCRVLIKLLFALLLSACLFTYPSLPLHHTSSSLALPGVQTLSFESPDLA